MPYSKGLFKNLNNTSLRNKSTVKLYSNMWRSLTPIIGSSSPPMKKWNCSWLNIKFIMNKNNCMSCAFIWNQTLLSIIWILSRLFYPSKMSLKLLLRKHLITMEAERNFFMLKLREDNFGKQKISQHSWEGLGSG